MRCIEVNIHANMIEVTWSHQGLIRLLKNAMIPLTRTQTLCHKKSHGTVVFGPNLRAGYDGMLKKTCTAGPFPGDLFLWTGTSFARIGKLNGKIELIKYLKEIAIPNSLWTAGCCVRQKGISQSFAVMGNSVRKYNSQSFTLQITVAELQNILTSEVSTYYHIGGPNVDLFPGDPDCAKNNMGKLPPLGPGR